MVLIFLNLTLMLVIAATTMFCSHPISLAGAIVVMTFLICLLNFMILPTSWYAFIFFLIFLGGVMVMFMYVTSLASNENFLLDWKMLPIATLILISSVMFLSFFQFETPSFSSNIDTNPMVYKIYSSLMNSLISTAMIFLLFTLIVVVEVIKILKSPLRSFL